MLKGFKSEMAISDLKPLISYFLPKTPTRCLSGLNMILNSNESLFFASSLFQDRLSCARPFGAR